MTPLFIILGVIAYFAIGCAVTYTGTRFGPLTQESKLASGLVAMIWPPVAVIVAIYWLVCGLGAISFVAPSRRSSN